MTDSNHQDDSPKTPPDQPERTTPYEAGGRSEATTDINPLEPSLRVLAERYDLLEEVGRGGMGIVYRARDRETGDVVALKVLQPDVANRPELIERFKAELLLARKITHKNVCRVYELNRFGPVAAISMEYVEGESLRALLNRVEGLSVRQGLKILAQVMAGLAEAHARGVVHRDLKPENIVIARDGTVKVMDFGIARSLETDSTKTGTLIGTPAYMSPEQVEGKPVDARSDLYALGLLMYEMFTGQLAFQADTPAALALKRLQEPPPSPRAIDPYLPDHLDRAIERCLQRDPKKRFQSVAELEAALAKRPEPRAAPGEAGDVPLPLHLTRWQRADWLLLPLAAAGLLLFFSFFEGSSLASRTPVAFERAALPRLAQEYAQRAGAPVSKDYRVGAIPVADRYEYLAATAGAPAARELANNLVPYFQWYVAWVHPDRRPTEVWVDNRGSLVGLVRHFPAGSAGEISVEESRPLAEKALREFFGREAADLRLRTAALTTLYGHSAAAFSWDDPADFRGLTRRYLVRIVEGEIASLDVFYALPPGYVWRAPIWQAVPIVLLVFVLVALGLYQRRQVDPTARWRIILTAFGFLVGLWTAARLPFTRGAVAPDPILLGFMASIFGLAFAFLMFFFSIAVERAVRRAALARFASFVRFFDRRILSQPCGLALLRGSLLGLAWLGLDTILVSSGTNHLGMRLDSLAQLMVLAWPHLGTSWPNSNLLMDALFQGLSVGMFLGFLISLLAGFVRRSWVAVIGAAALGAVFLVHPFFTWGAVQPYHWKLAVIFLDCVLLAFILLRFDLLTLMGAGFTFGFWWLNYRLLVMFEPTGAGEQWLAFYLWGVFVLAAAGIAFQAALMSGYRRLATAFQ